MGSIPAQIFLCRIYMFCSFLPPKLATNRKVWWTNIRDIIEAKWKCNPRKNTFRVQPHLYVIGNKFTSIRVTVFMAHWHSGSMFMTHYARHTTKQPDCLKGRGTNQYRQKKTLIIKLGIFSWVQSCSASHSAAQVTSSWFHFHNGDHNLCGQG